MLSHIKASPAPTTRQATTLSHTPSSTMNSKCYANMEVIAGMACNMLYDATCERYEAKSGS